MKVSGKIIKFLHIGQQRISCDVWIIIKFNLFLSRLSVRKFINDGTTNKPGSLLPTIIAEHYRSNRYTSPSLILMSFRGRQCAHTKNLLSWLENDEENPENCIKVNLKHPLNLPEAITRILELKIHFAVIQFRHREGGEISLHLRSRLLPLLLPHVFISTGLR